MENSKKTTVREKEYNEKKDQEFLKLKTEITQFQNELIKTKQQLGDALNAAREHGGMVLQDKILTLMAEREKQS